METSEAISTDKVTVVIQINPQEAKDGVVFVDGQQARGVSHNTALKGFFKAQPKALGYISTGSLSVAAQNKLHPCVLKASLGMNVISAITAGISIILMGADIGITTQERPNCRYGYDCLIPQGFGSGILGILLVFSILQLIISIFISVFACKATSSTDSTVVNVAVNQGY
uniref:Membrane-spanning 4-domains, subfamily A, member 17C.1 n=1 Tax=Cyprinus carpio carpio TaxID=630221 RepID=A0A8C1FGR8_CYPCA